MDENSIRADKNRCKDKDNNENNNTINYHLETFINL